MSESRVAEITACCECPHFSYALKKCSLGKEKYIKDSSIIHKECSLDTSQEYAESNFNIDEEPPAPGMSGGKPDSELQQLANEHGIIKVKDGKTYFPERAMVHATHFYCIGCYHELTQKQIPLIFEGESTGCPYCRGTHDLIKSAHGEHELPPFVKMRKAVAGIEGHLIDLIKEYCKVSSLKHESLDEMLYIEGLTTDQFTRIEQLIKAWEGWEAIDKMVFGLITDYNNR
jgi:hypothetical protein